MRADAGPQALCLSLAFCGGFSMSRKKETEHENYSITYDNLAMPEIHTGQVPPKPERKPMHRASVTYDTLAVPEVHIRSGENDAHK